MIGSLDGKRIFTDSLHGDPETSESIGIALAERLLAMGGGAVLDEIRKMNP